MYVIYCMLRMKKKETESFWSHNIHTYSMIKIWFYIDERNKDIKFILKKEREKKLTLWSWQSKE